MKIRYIITLISMVFSSTFAQNKAMDALAYNKKGNEFMSKRKYDEAIQCYDNAIKLDPRFWRSLGNKGLLYYKLEKYELSKQFYEQSVEINPTNTPNLYNLGVVNLQLGNIESATINWEDCLKIDPNFKQAKRSLEKLKTYKKIF